MLLFLTVTRCIFLSVPLLYHSMGQIIIFQISCMLCVSLSHFQPIFTKFGKNLFWGGKKELIRLESKSENVFAFPYFNPAKNKIYRRDRQFPAKY